ncbi:MAG: dienelactone hydrolase family protein [Polyangiaceae bacterium]|nr:dienelactone hydrolase family protein [Polyangiaceae bacterium]
MGESIEFKRPDGQSCPGYVTGAAGAPGVVLIQEWWGLNDQMKGLADRMADAGFRALVPDLYRGKIAKDGDEANHMMGELNFLDAAEQDIQGAVSFLGEAGTKVGVAGFCMGGALTLLSAVRVNGMTAGACFYGIPPAAVADPKTIKIPVQCHFANIDDWCTPDAVNGLEADFKAGGVNYELFRYDAQHAFMNEKRPEVYDAACAKQAWDRAVDFFKRTLA